ncbi:hypothetical protein ACOSQ2_018223 [Xanthoceras sorbifolium]
MTLLYSSGDLLLVSLLFFFILDAIVCCMRGPVLSVREILPWCCNFLEDFASANSLVPHAGVDRFIRWIPPISGVLKLNSDASFDVVRKKSGLGVPIDLLLDSEIAEAMAILLGLSVAAEASLSVGSVESDAANVISSLNLHSLSLKSRPKSWPKSWLYFSPQSSEWRDLGHVLLFGFLLNTSFSF